MSSPERHVIRALRGELVETTHAVSVAVVAPDGQLVAACGTPDLAAPLRSTAKPVQALALIVSGAADRFALTPQDLAIATASHEGTPQHVDAAAALLSRIGASPADLRCGFHWPIDEPSRHNAVRAGLRTPLHNNCSGKHAGMVASALALGAPVDTYLDVHHPLQVLIRDLHAQLAQTPHLSWALDGCSAPTWSLSVRRLALMYARLAAPLTAPAELVAPLERIFEAMRAHPELVAGPGILDTVLMQAVDGLVAKRGAAGTYGLALRDTPFGPVGVAIKVHDGSAEARGVAVVAVLDALGVAARVSDAVLGPLRSPRRLNHRGTVVGSYEAALDLAFTQQPGHGSPP